MKWLKKYLIASFLLILYKRLAECNKEKNSLSVKHEEAKNKDCDKNCPHPKRCEDKNKEQAKYFYNQFLIEREKAKMLEDIIKEIENL